MIYKDNILYLEYNEIADQITSTLKERLLNSEHRFIGDISKVRYSKKEIGQELAKQGYLTKRISQEGKRKVYYYKPKQEQEKRISG